MNRKGMTLVEILIVGGVMFTLLSGMALVVTQSGQQVWARTDARIASIDTAQRAMDRIGGDLRRASQASIQCAPPQPPETILLRLDPAGPDITYARTAAGQLVQTTNGVAQVMADNLTTFTPTCMGNGVVKLRLTTTVDQAKGGVPYTLESAVWAQSP